MEGEESIKKHLKKAIELKKNAVKNSQHYHFMHGWENALKWVLGDENIKI